MTSHVIPENTKYAGFVFAIVAMVLQRLISMEIFALTETWLMDQQVGFRVKRLLAFAACPLLQVNSLPVDSFQLTEIRV
jgi:hypothetical protein